MPLRDILNQDVDPSRLLCNRYAGIELHDVSPATKSWTGLSAEKRRAIAAEADAAWERWAETGRP